MIINSFQLWIFSFMMRPSHSHFTIDFIKNGVKYGITTILVLTFLSGHSGLAQSITEVTDDQSSIPISLGILPFLSQSDEEHLIARELLSVLMSDLHYTNRFHFIDTRMVGNRPSSVHEQPRFTVWQQIDTQVLLNAKVSIDQQILSVMFRLWDVNEERYLTGLAYQTPTENWRRISHIMADTIYETLIKEPGYFDTRIAFVAEGGSPHNRTRHLAISDQDGQNYRFLTDGSSPILTPHFAPNGQQVTYVSYFQNRPQVYLLDLNTGETKSLGDDDSICYAPRFSHDGTKLIMSRSIEEGYSNLFIVDLATFDVQQLTFTRAIDTSASFSPDGQYIVFESDRSGSQQLYIMALNTQTSNDPTTNDPTINDPTTNDLTTNDPTTNDLTTNDPTTNDPTTNDPTTNDPTTNDPTTNTIRLLSTEEQGHYSEPVWSPRGDLIAFTRKDDEGRVAIGVIRPDGSDQRILTESFHLERPTWSPNGDILMYVREIPIGSTHDRLARLYTITLDGNTERRIVMPFNISDPTWGRVPTETIDPISPQVPVSQSVSVVPSVSASQPVRESSVTQETQIVQGSPEDFHANVLRSIHFSGNGLGLEMNQDAITILNSQSDWLHSYPEIHIQIEAYSDARLTRNYSIGLGLLRAEKVKALLVSRGIASSSIITTTFGKNHARVCDLRVTNQSDCEARIWWQDRRTDTVAIREDNI